MSTEYVENTDIFGYLFILRTQRFSFRVLR